MAEIKSYTTDTSAATSGLHAGHIASNLSKYEAARTSFFTVTINDYYPDAPTGDVLSLSPAAFGSSNTGNFADAQSNITLSVVKCDIPHFTLSVLEYRRGNEKIKYAGVPEFGSGSLVVDDIIGLGTKNILMAWQGLAYNIKTKKGGRMADYKKNCTLCEYTQDYELIRTWTLYGCWISELQEDSFDKENDGARKITAKLEYDRAEMEVEDNYLILSSNSNK